MIDDKTARKICARYFLDCRSIKEISKELGVSRQDVRDACDDPHLQAEYLQRAERARRRTRLRSASAAEIALEKQVELLSQDVPDKLIPTQQRTAQHVLRAGLDSGQQSGEIRIVFAQPIALGMPRARREDGDGA